MNEPAKAPCKSCPYRCDVPSGVWSEDEYEKLPPYDEQTGFQPSAVFFCHQQDGRVCAGWASVHGNEESLSLRLAISYGILTVEEAEKVVEYVSPVPVFSSSKEAAEHGMAEIKNPGIPARRTVERLERKLK